MTVDEIKTELERRGWSYADLAQKLALGKSAIYEALNKGTLRENLRRHIELVLSTPESAILIYKVNLTEKKVYDLTAQQQFPATEEGQKQRAEAVAAVIKHNMQMLEEAGRTAELGDELKQIIKVLDENLPKKEGEK